MSIYCTTLCFENDPNDPESDPPYVYQGSNVGPHPRHLRGGNFDLGEIPEHIGGHWRDFLRVSIDEGEEDWESATVLLHRRQVTELAETLIQWLDRDDHPTP